MPNESDRIVESKCINCDHKMDAATCVNQGEQERIPSKGDISICINCGYVMAFDKDLRLRQLTPFEQNLADGSPDISRMQQRIMTINETAGSA